MVCGKDSIYLYSFLLKIIDLNKPMIRTYGTLNLMFYKENLTMLY